MDGRLVSTFASKFHARPADGKQLGSNLEQRLAVGAKCSCRSIWGSIVSNSGRIGLGAELCGLGRGLHA